MIWSTAVAYHYYWDYLLLLCTWTQFPLACISVEVTYENFLEWIKCTHFWQPCIGDPQYFVLTLHFPNSYPCSSHFLSFFKTELSIGLRIESDTHRNICVQRAYCGASLVMTCTLLCQSFPYAHQNMYAYLALLKEAQNKISGDKQNEKWAGRRWDSSWRGGCFLSCLGAGQLCHESCVYSTASKQSIHTVLLFPCLCSSQ